MSAIVFVEIIVGLAVIALLFIAFDSVITDTIKPWGVYNITDSNATTAFNRMMVVWPAIPFIVVLIFMMYGIASAQKKEDYYGQPD